MKILLHGINYTPELVGIGKYTGEMAAWLSAQGHDVHVVTAPPYYPEWKVRNGYSTYVYRHENINGVEVWRCPLWIPTEPTGLKRILHLASFALSSLPVMFRQLFWHPDVVMVIEPPLFCAPAALLIGKLSRAKTLLHIQDFEVDAAFNLGLLKAPVARWCVGGLEKILLKFFDQASTISPNMMAKLEEKGLDAEKILFFPNWVDAQSIYPLEKTSPMRTELGIDDDAIVVLYSGNMGEKQGLEIIIDAARQLAANSRLVFVMCGDGAACQRLKNQADGLTNMIWLPLQPLEKLNALLNLADIHLLPQRADVADLVMPSKLTGMLASGRAILATARAGTQIARVLEETGIVVSPGDSSRFVEALQSLADNSELRKKLGQRARQYALDHLDREVVLSNFEQNLKILCGQ